MLIEFNISNFMSINEKQTFSLVAAKNKELMDSHTFDAPLAGQASMKLLRTAAIYGPNAGGKTNLLHGLRIMREIVLKSALEKNRGDTLPVVPFKLDHAARQAPSTFEVLFIVNGIRYQYGFSATAERIIEEGLYVSPRNRVQRWFERTWNADEQKHDWVFGTFLTGDKTVWQRSTRDNALLLSTAVQLNSKQLEPVYDWFKTTLHCIGAGGIEQGYSASLCETGDDARIPEFLKKADLGIDDVRIEKEKFNPQELPEDMPDDLRQALIKEMEHKELYEVKTVHHDADGKLIEFNLEDESNGTRKIFTLAGPFLDSLDNGYIVFIDELGGSLHPELVKFLVGLFNNKDTNTGTAQLVFTTHETHMLDQTILRRDQIWFCEKDKAQATRVYPLTDFRPRKGRENLELAYLSGRYGALPFVPEPQT